MNLPIEFENKMSKLMAPDEFQALLESYDNDKSKGVRINTLKADDTIRESLPFATTAVPWCPTGYYIDPEVRPGKNPYYYAGVYYVQEPTAMTAAEVLDPEPGDVVLDLCAAPGGKTSQLACKLQGEGLLVANELVKNRSAILAQNVERMGITNCLITSEFPERLAEAFPGFFNKILVDAPCSGEGMFRKDPAVAEEWSPDRVEQCAARQAKIITSVDKLLAPGGVLVYSTCTFSPEENEEIVEFLIGEYGYEVLPAVLSGISDTGRAAWGKTDDSRLAQTMRVMPYHVQGEGHFVAKLRKPAVNIPKNPSRAKAKKSPLVKAGRKELKDFFHFRDTQLKDTDFDNLYLYYDNLYHLPYGLDEGDLAGLKIVRPGLHLGTLKKNRFEPSHTLAMALTPDQFTSTFELADEDKANAFLKGEVIPGDNTGWTLMTYQGYPLGFAKGSQGMLKNHYPKGLRIRKK